MVVNGATAAAASSLFGGFATTTTTTTTSAENRSISLFRSKMIEMGMRLYIVLMCLALPMALLPQRAMFRCGVISKVTMHIWALKSAEFCARWLLRIVPFVRLDAIVDPEMLAENNRNPPQPAIWCSNHQSMLDVFLLLAADLRLRGKYKRPIQVVYWKSLEDNPITKLLFTQAGFIPVAMAANKAGEDNEYDKKSFKDLLRGCKEAFANGFDVGILPEGQLNPHPEQGLLPIFGGAYTLARLSKRPIYMMAMHGANRLWHAERGMHVTDNRVQIRVYPIGRNYASADEFKSTFQAVVGTFATHGRDLPQPQLQAWLTGQAWNNQQQQQQQQNSNNNNNDNSNSTSAS